MKRIALLLLALLALSLYAAEPSALKLIKTILLPGVTGRFDHFALDIKGHRLFVGCRNPARLVVFDTATGKKVADLAISGDIDDLFYDAARRRLYASCGEGFVDVIAQLDMNRYERREQIATAPGARTAYFDPERSEFYLAVPERRAQKAEIRVFEVK
jgi:hypothetical protein